MRIKNKKGFIAIFITILIMIVVVSVGLGLSILVVNSQRILINAVSSKKVYYLTEIGVEDALLRLRQNPQMTSFSYAFNLEGGTVNVGISDVLGGSRTILSSANIGSRIKKIKAVYTILSSEASFFYGVQVGEGGMEIGNNARVKGNVFSNGTISSSNKGYIDNNVVVANNGNKIKNLEIGGDALSYSCENCKITGDLTYVSGGTISGCIVSGSTFVRTEKINPEPLPIPESQIINWKQEGLSGGVINNNVVYNSVTGSLGPVQIGTPSAPKNLEITNNARVKITGTVYVTGNIIISNNAVLELDSGYGSTSGVILADGRITLKNNAILRGSGHPGSYVLILSTNPSLDPSYPAILVGNNAQGAIFYTTSGLIYLSNNMKAREVTGYKIKINNNAEVEYESGLQNVYFSSGPGGSWTIESWKVVE
ncbi:MAG: hypothetical protein PHI53_01940 [Candidatus Pacebacteria bacterium]|nr:hypothetical protein [Candidatus Paceibacterota bacterium]